MTKTERIIKQLSIKPIETYAGAGMVRCAFCGVCRDRRDPVEVEDHAEDCTFRLAREVSEEKQ